MRVGVERGCADENQSTADIGSAWTLVLGTRDKTRVHGKHRPSGVKGNSAHGQQGLLQSEAFCKIWSDNVTEEAGQLATQLLTASIIIQFLVGNNTDLLVLSSSWYLQGFVVI